MGSLYLFTFYIVCHYAVTKNLLISFGVATVETARHRATTSRWELITLTLTASILVSICF